MARLSGTGTTAWLGSFGTRSRTRTSGLLLILVVICLIGEATGQRRVKRAAKSVFLEPGVIIGIIVGVTGLLVVVGVTALLCRLFCCKNSTRCCCCHLRADADSETDHLPDSEKDNRSVEENEWRNLERNDRTRHSNRYRQQNQPGDRRNSTTKQDKGWKELDINKFIKSSADQNPQESNKRSNGHSKSALESESENNESSPAAVHKRTRNERTMQISNKQSATERFTDVLSRNERDHNSISFEFEDKKSQDHHSPKYNRTNNSKHRPENALETRPYQQTDSSSDNTSSHHGQNFEDNTALFKNQGFDDSGNKPRAIPSRRFPSPRKHNRSREDIVQQSDRNTQHFSSSQSTDMDDSSVKQIYNTNRSLYEKQGFSRDQESYHVNHQRVTETLANNSRRNHHKQEPTRTTSHQGGNINQAFHQETTETEV